MERLLVALESLFSYENGLEIPSGKQRDARYFSLVMFPIFAQEDVIDSDLFFLITRYHALLYTAFPTHQTRQVSRYISG